MGIGTRFRTAKQSHLILTVLIVLILFQLFNTVIETSEKNEDLQIRLNTLYGEITLAIYTNVSRGLFERHKLMFSFMLCVAIQTQEGIVVESQWNYLLRGPIVSKTELPKKPDYPTITENMWIAVNFLATTFPLFEDLITEVIYVIKITIDEFVQVYNYPYTHKFLLCC